ncbi:uromodulin-like [Hypanus sabinus]|uniref:uromodulin-like n=1 Tax=Hypanus sabinus TaxID=79690 RepID=UPI0028C43118|nr:uromodulin-like [Hypanus sabinus]
MSEGISGVAVTGCPEVRPSDRKSIVVPSNQIHFHIHFPWQFADYMNDPTSKAYLKLAGISRSKVRQLFLDSGELTNADVELLHLRRGSDGVEMNMTAHVQLNSTPASLEYLLSNLSHTRVSAEVDVLFWDDEDECSSAKNDCPVGADCINTFDSFTCVCQQGYFDPDFQSRSCRDHGVFADCRMDSMKISVSKEFLVDLMQTGLQLVLNDGVCGAEEELDFYTFTVTDTKAYCGGQLEMNETHKIFKHVITNEYHSESPIIREPRLILTVNCAYSRSSLVKMPLDSIKQIRMFEPIIEYNSDPLHLAIFLYKDNTFSPSTMYGESPTIQLNEDLYLEVRASPTGISEAAFVLEVVSCWATATADRLGRLAFQFLQDGCPVDETFRWYSVNGLSSNTRFAIKMFRFTEMVNSPIYLHCQVTICNVEAAGDCLTECSSAQIPKRDKQREGTTLHGTVTELVSTGSIALRSHPSQPEDLEETTIKWHGTKPLLWIISGVTGISLLMVVVVISLKVTNGQAWLEWCSS